MIGAVTSRIGSWAKKIASFRNSPYASGKTKTAKVVYKPCGKLPEGNKVSDRFIAEAEIGQNLEQALEPGRNEAGAIRRIIPYEKAEGCLAGHPFPKITLSHCKFIEIVTSSGVYCSQGFIYPPSSYPAVRISCSSAPAFVSLAP